MFIKIRNLFKKRKDKATIAVPKNGIGKLAWESVNLENEPKIKQVKVI